MDKFDENSFGAEDKRTSNSGTSNIKTELLFKCCISQSLLYSNVKPKMGENCRITNVNYIHKNLTNMSSIKGTYSDNG